MSRPARQSSLKADQSRAGVVEWFRPGEYERVETVLTDLRTLGIRIFTYRHLLGRLVHVRR